MRTTKNKTNKAPVNMNKKGKNRTRNKPKTRKRKEKIFREEIIHLVILWECGEQ